MEKYTINELLTFVGISRATLYRYIGKGWVEPPKKTVTGRVFFNGEHINQILAITEEGEPLIQVETKKKQVETKGKSIFKRRNK